MTVGDAGMTAAQHLPSRLRTKSAMTVLGVGWCCVYLPCGLWVKSGMTVEDAGMTAAQLLPSRLRIKSAMTGQLGVAVCCVYPPVDSRSSPE